MQKINLRELYPDVYKTDVFVDVAEEVVAAIRSQEQDDAAYERRKFRHKAHYSLNREDGIENDALNRSLTPEEVLEQKLLREEVYAALMQLTAIQARRIYARFYQVGHEIQRTIIDHTAFTDCCNIHFIIDDLLRRTHLSFENIEFHRIQTLIKIHMALFIFLTAATPAQIISCHFYLLPFFNLPSIITPLFKVFQRETCFLTFLLP